MDPLGINQNTRSDGATSSSSSSAVALSSTPASSMNPSSTATGGTHQLDKASEMEHASTASFADGQQGTTCRAAEASGN